jgi:hypothetical protein
MEKGLCQLHDLPNISEPPGPFTKALQRVFKLRVSFRRRAVFLINAAHHVKKGKKSMLTVVPTYGLQPGDIVRVRSKKEIQSTLDNWNKLKGCTFLREMEPFCGTVQKVRKRVNRFLNETDYLVKKSKGIVILENVFCEGTKDFGPCDRSCFFFWREEWLEKNGTIPRTDKNVSNGTSEKHA